MLMRHIMEILLPRDKTWQRLTKQACRAYLGKSGAGGLFSRTAAFPLVAIKNQENQACWCGSLGACFAFGRLKNLASGIP